MKKLMSLALFCLAALPLNALAHEGHAHKVMGTVVSITTERIEVSNPEGKRETFVLATETVYKKEKTVVAVKDVLVGGRVVLSIVEKDGKKSVSEVLIGIAPEAPLRKP